VGLVQCAHLSPSKVNEARFGYSSLFNNITQQLAGVEDVDAELGVPVKITDKNSWVFPISCWATSQRVWKPTSSPFRSTTRSIRLSTISPGSPASTRFAWRRVPYNQFPQVGNEFPRGQFFFTAHSREIRTRRARLCGRRLSAGLHYADHHRRSWCRPIFATMSGRLMWTTPGRYASLTITAD